jgi:AcrR family transcriptional regulator
VANSNITKQAFSIALKELMQEVPFDKIRIADICNRCGMNRKSFYYHFKDKYDLLNSANKHDLDWVLSNTCILHFCGKKKPWLSQGYDVFMSLYKYFMYK